MSRHTTPKPIAWWHFIIRDGIGGLIIFVSKGNESYHNQFAGALR